MKSTTGQITELVNNYVGSLIEVAEMPAEDKAALKAHLLAAEEILLRNGLTKLQTVMSSLTGSILSRLG